MLEKLRICKLKDLSKAERQALIKRSHLNLQTILADTIAPMAKAIGQRGLAAIKEFALKYDGYFPEPLVLNKEELYKSYKNCITKRPKEIEAFSLAWENIRKFHEAQIPENLTITINQNELGFSFIPFDRVALYVPGGKALYPSTILMGVVPARAAKVGDVSIFTPPSFSGQVDEFLKAVAYLAGADRIVQLGGAQAILAAALGIEELSLLPVDFVYGPGNVYVAAAKTYVFSQQWCGIDSFAGPSEVVILADETANPIYIAHDLLAQAEHDENASAILLTTSEELAEKTRLEIVHALNNRGERKNITLKAVENNGKIFLVRDLEEAVSFINEYAPEHLEIQTQKDAEILAKIRCAGSIFLGPYSPVAAGDYYSGTNHILPTGGACRFASGVSTHTFYRRITWQKLSKEGLKQAALPIALMSRVEGLFAEHGYSVLARFPDLEKEVIKNANP